MSPALTTHPDIKVRAEAVKLFVDAFSVFPSIAGKYVERLSPSRATGIALDPWLRTLQDVLADIGPNALFQMGQRVIHNPNFSPVPRRLDEALRQIDVAYHMSHRKGGLPMFDPATGAMLEGIGHYLVQPVADQKKILVNSDTPYPCTLEHGIVSGVAARFESRAVVSHDAGSRCRTRGSAYCAYSVSW